MRLRRLDLVRYGHFTDLSLDLPAGSPDLHLLFGPNEAGKSTSLAALEDLLFGIPRTSPLNFLHDYGAMRIGGVLEGDGQALALRRRKGNRDTLLAGDDTVLPGGEAALAPFLGGADRAFFTRMFSLDHHRLREGGREILEAQDEVGQMLFAAGAGIAGLRTRLARLKEEADALWGPRKAARREYARAEERLKAAEGALREQIVTASRWEELRRAEAAAARTYAELEERIAGTGAELARLIRIRRVHGHVRRKAELDARIAALRPTPSLPDDARQRLEAAEREAARAAARSEPAAEQLAAAEAEHAALAPDTVLLERAPDIRQLQERRIEVRAERASLPRRRQELAAAESQLQHLATDLDWPPMAPEALLARIPARPKLAALRALLTRRGALATAVQAARAAAQEAQDRHAATERALAAMAPPADTGLLAAQLAALREGGDPAARIATAEARLADAAAAVRRGLEGLHPPPGDAAALAALRVPPRAAVQDWRDRHQDLAQRRRACADRLRTASAERERHHKAAARILRIEHVVSPEQLVQARRERDSGWQVLRRSHQAGATLPETELDAHEASVQATDILADRRFETAEAAARLAVTARQVAEQDELREVLAKEQAALAEEAKGLAAEWRQLWSALPVAPEGADAMLEWLEGREAILEQEAARDRAERELAALQQQEEDARHRLLEALAAGGTAVEPYRGQRLKTVLEAAQAVRQHHEKLAEERARLEAGLREAGEEQARRCAALTEAEAAWADWQRQWAPAALACGLSGDGDPAAVEAQLRALEEMREIAIPADNLRQERIAKIERDIAGFEAETAALTAAIASDLADSTADEAVLALARRLEAAEAIQARRTEKASEIAAAGQRLAECETAARTAQEAIDDLQRQAGTQDIAGLKAAIERSESLRAAQAEQAEAIAALEAGGDDLPLAELEADCADIDIDQAKAREQVLQAEAEALNEQLLQAREVRAQAQSAFRAVGGDDGAARAEADRQSALAAMEDVAERYLRLRAAALLLEWAIDRYRQEKQAPLLARASAHFAMLTGGSFSELALEFDEGDRLHLTGRRPDGARVGIDGMSSGTADQLYLALRVAAVEDYLARATPLPFIADDLFVNFDDARAEAGFRVLGDLARHSQVLVFTHHRHLVDLARAALGPDLNIRSLADGSAM